MPIKKLRENRAEAGVALRSIPFFAANGARREEILFMGDLLRSNQNTGVVERAEELAAEAVARLLGQAAGGKVV